MAINIESSVDIQKINQAGEDLIENARKMYDSLQKIKGIGPQKAKSLLLAFESMEELRAADLSQLACVKGIREADAKAVYDFFHGGKEE